MNITTKYVPRVSPAGSVGTSVPQGHFLRAPRRGVHRTPNVNNLRNHKSFARLYKGGRDQRQSLWSRSAERETPFDSSLRKG